jgi:peptide deformylase
MWKPVPPKHRKFRKEVFTQLAAVSPFMYHIGDSPQLREASKEVSVSQITSPDFQKKLGYLKRCLLRYRKLTGLGRGIAGVQVGIPERIAVIYMPETVGNVLIIINPKITDKSDQQLSYPEICMSASPAIAPVVRPAWIEFEYYGETGKKQYWDKKANDLPGKIYNRVFQHEIDHMDGIINIDLVESKEIIFESDPGFYKNATFTTIP